MKNTVWIMLVVVAFALGYIFRGGNNTAECYRALDSGAIAYHIGRTPEDSPYDEGSLLDTLWLTGYETSIAMVATRKGVEAVRELSAIIEGGGW